MARRGAQSDGGDRAGAGSARGRAASDAEAKVEEGAQQLGDTRDLTPDGTRGFTMGENRLYFRLWAPLLKAPLLLSANLPSLEPAVLAIVNNSDVVALDQDLLGVQARAPQPVPLPVCNPHPKPPTRMRSPCRP